MGLETEYALHLTSSDDAVGNGLDPVENWFHDLIDRVAGEVPVAPSLNDLNKFFLANGSCLSLEPNSRGVIGQGMIESGTAESASPRAVVASQRGLDDLLVRHIQDVFPEDDPRLVKNSEDSFGNTYGQQENYTTTIASGWRLFGWRLGLILLLPLLVFYKFSAFVWLRSVFGFEQLQQRMRESFSRRKITQDVDLGEALLDPTLQEGVFYAESDSDVDVTTRPETIRFAARGLRIMHLPLAIALDLNVQLFALIRQRRNLIPFLASRMIWDGGGRLDEHGRFWVSARGTRTERLIGTGRRRHEYSILSVHHWLLELCSEPWYSFRSWRKLFRSRQRVQISCGDSVPSSMIEFLRLGATSLVLDVIEQHSEAELPTLRKPIESIHRLSKDWMMLTKIVDQTGARRTAIELQRLYLAAVRVLLSKSTVVPKEAWEIVSRWSELLDKLENCNHDEESQYWLLGRVHWFSKKWLLDQAPADASLATRKKVDIRYHELSRDGYYSQLASALDLDVIVDERLRERSLRLPPENSPAKKRGYLIREFGSQQDTIRVTWDRAEIVIDDVWNEIKL